MTNTPKRSTRAGASRRPWVATYRLTGAVLALVCLATTLFTSVSVAAARKAAASTRVPASQQLAVLEYEHRAYRFPQTNAPLQASIPAQRPITDEQTTLPVLAQATDLHGRRWLKVMIPGRPNSSTGWIKQAGTEQRSTGWNIQVSLGARRIWVYFRGKMTKTFLAVVGKPSTPTPTGHFFVEETVIMPASLPGGPYALALSARSDALSEFDGGPGQIGIHGRDGLGGTPGQAQSHGCMRLMTPDITWLAARIGPGTPVTIRQ